MEMTHFEDLVSRFIRENLFSLGDGGLFKMVMEEEEDNSDDETRDVVLL